ncbi:unnamed protein product [Ostreobium quekettii]|uniref:Exonuclease domain-containing protein n=1 Tax=Ostreobium quekettii TaxID=121088 RepID=A0A8S1IQP5_9CHLO|nr:unnamed protein product [Ostreobium quekettii]|eukprot:evm.model.scf_51.1 EVM.evm.TU.scf_51.1   scf_51:1636-5492(+)
MRPGRGRSQPSMDMYAMSSFAPLTLLAEEEREDEEQEEGCSDGAGSRRTSQDAAQRSGRGYQKWPFSDPLVWIDLEMSGLILETDTIIEIACIVTDSSLQRQIEGPSIAIHHPDDVFDRMDAWCTEHHGASGLTDRCKASMISLEQAEELVLDFVKQLMPPGVALLAGNSVHVDKTFLRRYMPMLHDYLNYRILDVSTVKELCRRWYPKEWKRCPRKKNNHTALSDIRESIEELKHYRTAIFKKQ